MQTIKWRPLLLLGLALAMMVLSACGQGNTKSGLSPLQVLQNSANTMKNLQTSHVDLNATSQINGANASGFEIPGNVDVTLKGSGSQSIPDNAQKMDMTLNINSFSTPVSELIKDNTVYIQTSDGKWYSFDKTAFGLVDCGLASFLSAPTIDLNSLLVLTEHISLTDHGNENVRGQSLRHLTANIDKAALKQLLSDNPKLKCNLGSQDLNTVKNFNSSVDLYIDEQKFYVHRSRLQVALGTNDKGQTATSKSDLTIDLSNFNQPVTITAPANATPLTDPKQLLSKLSGFPF
jgi:Family of unknown function (DUF6612)